MILPPKRWQEDGPQFDNLRHLKWYRRLLKRKKLIPALKQAHKLVKEGVPQWKAAAEFQIDERELRDYGKLFGAGVTVGMAEQKAIDAAYAIYVDSGGRHPFSYCVERSAEYHGLNPRALRELWEIDPAVYPSAIKDRNDKTNP